MALARLEYPKGLTEFSNNAEATNDAVSYIQFEVYDRFKADSQLPHRTISLYMPETIENPQTVSWDGQSLGRGGVSEAEGAREKYDRAADYIINEGNKLWASMSGKLSGGIGGASGQDILANNEQKIINPYMKMLFRGVNFRNFEFSFKFTPQSVEESNTIYRICQEFRASSLPEAEDGGFKWRYPREFEITYKYQGKDHPWLNKFKRCVITSCHVNYAGPGYYASMRNGFPAESHLRLQFTEIDLLTRADINLGDDGEFVGPSF